MEMLLFPVVFSKNSNRVQSYVVRVVPISLLNHVNLIKLVHQCVVHQFQLILNKICIIDSMSLQGGNAYYIGGSTCRGCLISVTQCNRQIGYHTVWTENGRPSFYHINISNSAGYCIGTRIDSISSNSDVIKFGAFVENINSNSYIHYHLFYIQSISMCNYIQTTCYGLVIRNGYQLNINDSIFRIQNHGSEVLDGAFLINCNINGQIFNYDIHNHDDSNWDQIFKNEIDECVEQY